MKTAYSVSYNISDDEGLSYVYFDFGNFEYFTISFNPYEDNLPYLENSEQTFSIQSKNVYYSFKKNSIEFEFGDKEKEALGLYNKLIISLHKISSSDIEEIKKILIYIFENLKN